jgi:hypothetical protein
MFCHIHDTILQIPLQASPACPGFLHSSVKSIAVVAGECPFEDTTKYCNVLRYSAIREVWPVNAWVLLFLPLLFSIPEFVFLAEALLISDVESAAEVEGFEMDLVDFGMAEGTARCREVSGLTIIILSLSQGFFSFLCKDERGD